MRSQGVADAGRTSASDLARHLARHLDVDLAEERASANDLAHYLARDLADAQAHADACSREVDFQEGGRTHHVVVEVLTGYAEVDFQEGRTGDVEVVTLDPLGAVAGRRTAQERLRETPWL